jgi:ATP-dependent DNA helicase DinG
MTPFASLMAEAGLTPRTYQAIFAEQVATALRGGAPIAVAAQAGTGVGKTWALTHAALEAAQAGRRVIWSTHTTLLRAQVLETLHRALAAAGLAGSVTAVERRGRADFPSATRTRRLRHALKDRGAEAEVIAQLDALAAWGGTIGEFTARHGELAVPQSLVCLTAASPEEEQAAYAAQRDAAAGAAIVVQTHALTLIEARFGRLDAALVILDEADTLPSVAAGAAEMRLSLDDLAALAEQVGADITSPLAALRQRAEGAALVWRDAALAESVRAVRTALREAAADASPELAQALADTADDLANFASIDAPKVGAALVQDGTLPVLAVAAVDAAGWLGHALKERQVVLMSATLAKAEGEDLASACRALGFHEFRPIEVTPEKFGEMRLRLADRRVPEPFGEGGVPSAAFFDYAAAMVREAAQGGRTLVLCASYGDVAALAERLPPGTIAQQRGEALAPLVERFRGEPGAVLVTPAAWAGLDLPGLVENVVILRLPIPRADALREAVLTEAITRRGMTREDARNILAAQGRAEAVRRLGQGMGRGIRTAEDRCTVWIADPRFPLPVSMVQNLRRRLTQGAAQGWPDMALAIPRRFRNPAGRSAFDRAEIVPLAPPRAAA